MKIFRMILLTNYFFASLAGDGYGAGGGDNTGSNRNTIDFEIGLGESAHGFTYTKNGKLLYNRQELSPKISVNKSEIPKFRLSVSQAKKLAAGIALDSYGKTILYFIDLEKMSSREIDEGNTAYKAFWSPSGNFLVVLCSYEGERFISINLANGKVSAGEFLSPPGSSNIWRIAEMPQWICNVDRLKTTVKETCNYYDDTICDGDRIIAVKAIEIDAATLRVSIIDKAGKTK